MLEKAGLPFEKIYANDQPDLAKSFGVMQAPTLVVSDGKDTKIHRSQRNQKLCEFHKVKAGEKRGCRKSLCGNLLLFEPKEV